MRHSLPSVATAALLLGLAIPAAADQKLERIALQLTGDRCAAQLPRLHAALSSLEGIRTIDLTSLPDHALIDIDLQQITLQALMPIITDTLVNTHCQAAPMESCISTAAPGLANTSHIAETTHAHTP